MAALDITSFENLGLVSIAHHVQMHGFRCYTIHAFLANPRFTSDIKIATLLKRTERDQTFSFPSVNTFLLVDMLSRILLCCTSLVPKRKNAFKASLKSFLSSEYYHQAIQKMAYDVKRGHICLFPKKGKECRCAELARAALTRQLAFINSLGELQGSTEDWKAFFNPVILPSEPFNFFLASKPISIFCQYMQFFCPEQGGTSKIQIIGVPSPDASPLDIFEEPPYEGRQKTTPIGVRSSNLTSFSRSTGAPPHPSMAENGKQPLASAADPSPATANPMLEKLKAFSQQGGARGPSGLRVTDRLAPYACVQLYGVLAVYLMSQRNKKNATSQQQEGIKAFVTNRFLQDEAYVRAHDANGYANFFLSIYDAFMQWDESSQVDINKFIESQSPPIPVDDWLYKAEYFRLLQGPDLVALARLWEDAELVVGREIPLFQKFRDAREGKLQSPKTPLASSPFGSSRLRTPPGFSSQSKPSLLGRPSAGPTPNPSKPAPPYNPPLSKPNQGRSLPSSFQQQSGFPPNHGVSNGPNGLQSQPAPRQFDPPVDNQAARPSFSLVVGSNGGNFQQFPNPGMQPVTNPVIQQPGPFEFPQAPTPGLNSSFPPQGFPSGSSMPGVPTGPPFSPFPN